MTGPLLLIDTDPGVDDALALLMAHQHARVCALTITAGNVGLSHTVRNACTLLDLLQTPTPVFAGCAGPLLHAPSEDAASVHGSDGFGDIGFPQPLTRPADEHAVQALLRLTRQHPRALTLVTLGPLTHLALALQLDPSLPERVSRLVIMGGAATGHGNTASVPAEFNIGFDPESAHVVFERFPCFDLVDWQAALRHALDESLLAAWLQGGDRRADFFARIFAVTRSCNARRKRRGVILPDALAMAVAIDPAIVTRAQARPVAIELQGRHTRGATVIDWEYRSDRRPNARVVLEVDQQRFSALVATALGAGSERLR